jgi:hypothetical protein
MRMVDVGGWSVSAAHRWVNDENSFLLNMLRFPKSCCYYTLEKMAVTFIAT